MSSALGYQNKFSTTLLSAASNVDTTIYLNALPTPSEGYLTIDEGLVTEEIIYYTSKGANFVTCPSVAAGRGLGGTTAVGHSSSAGVKMKITAQHFLGYQNATDLSSDVAGGWLPADSTWVYGSATTMTVSSSDAGKLAVGSRIRLSQSGTKYFYVTGVSGTTITISGGSDFTLANATITAPYLSNAVSPVGFPQWFNYTPTENGFTSPPTRVSRFRIIGRECRVSTTRSTNATSNSTAYNITAPVTSANIANQTWRGLGTGQNASSALSTPVYASIANNSTTINLSTDGTGAGWTASGTKGADFDIFYEI